MAVRNYIRPQWLHILFAAVGFLTLLITVIVAVVIFSTFIYVIVGILLGEPLRVIVDSLSISQVASDQADDLFAWIAGVLIFIVSLPYFVSYTHWLGHMLYD